MSDFNRVILVGRIGNELELKKSAQGVSYLKISLATHSLKSEQGNSEAKREQTTHWHRVVAFGLQAENCARFLEKGSKVMVEGSLESRVFTGDDGQKKTWVSILADRVHFMNRSTKGADLEPEHASVH